MKSIPVRDPLPSSPNLMRIYISCVQAQYVIRALVWRDCIKVYESRTICDEFSILPESETQSSDLLELRKDGEIISHIRLSGMSGRVLVTEYDPSAGMYDEVVYEGE